MARLIVRDNFLMEYFHLFRYQMLEVLDTKESRHKKRPKTVYHRCRIIKTGAIVTLYGHEIEPIQTKEL